MSSPTTNPERTVLFDEHLALDAVIVDFHGWEMPVRYGSIPEEHQRVRETAGLFDLGHMGRLLLRGPDAEAWLQRVLTNDTSLLEVGDARYTLICAEDGGIIDDAIIYRLPEEWFLVVNASNRPRVIQWLEQHRDGADAELVDASADQAMIAIQGPRARQFATPLFESPSRDWADLGYYQILSATFDGKPARVARTGYTGEDGYEIYVPSDLGPELWRRLLAAGGDDIAAIGLGARDTLRLEAGMALYGNEIDETTTPYDAGLGFAVKLDKAVPFIGRERLRQVKADGPRLRLRGFRVDGRRIARQGMTIFAQDDEVGRITSGAPSPTLGVPIAMGHLETSYADRLESALASGGDSVPEPEVDLRGRREKLLPEVLPFFSRTRKKGA